MPMKPSLTKSSFFNIALQLTTVVVPLISSMYVSRTILPEGLGELATVENLVSYFTALAPLGIASYGVRAVSRKRDNPEELSRVFSELVVLNAVSTVVFLVIYAVVLVVAFGEVPPVLYLIYGSLIVSNALNLEWLFTGLEQFVYISIRGIAVKALVLFLTVLLVRSPDDLYLYAALTCLSTVLNYLVNVVNARRFARLTLRGSRPLRHMRPVLILAGTSVLFSVYTKIDVTLLGLMCSSSVVAYYAYAYKAEEIGKMLCVAVTSVYTPRLSYEAVHDRVEHTRLISQAMLLNVYIALPMALGICVTAPRLIPLLFGEAFAPAVLTLQLFSALIVAKSVGNVIYQNVISTGREHYQLIAYAAGCVVNIALNLLLIPTFQQNGAVVATIATEVVLDCILVFLTRDSLRVGMTASFAASTAAGLLALGVVVALCTVFIENDLLSVIVSVALGAAAYAAVGVLLRNEIALALLGKLRRFGRMGVLRRD